MFPFGVLLFSLLTLSFDLGHTEKVVYQEEIFNEDMCQQKCGNRTHTMCRAQEYPQCSYKKFRRYNLASYRAINFNEILLEGHNGIRNRIAHRMRVSNMAELLWDFHLEEMAERYLRLCRPFEADECTEYVDDMTFEEFIQYYISGERGFLFVSQNKYCMRAKYFPLNFVERACSSWYHDCRQMAPPTFVRNPQTNRMFGILQGENNYTHFAFPYINRIGCSLASYEDNKLFCIICNYYPFFRTNDQRIIFENGPPATTCPVYFPMKGLKFDGICSAGRSGFRKALQQRGLVRKAQDDDDMRPQRLGVP